MVAVLVPSDENVARPAEDVNTVSAPRVLLLEVGSSSTVVSGLEQGGLRPIAESVSGEQAFRDALRTFVPDAVIAGNVRSGFGAGEALALLRAELPGAPLIVFAAAIDHQALVHAARAADGVVLHDARAELPRELEAAIKLRRPLRKLSPRQLEVLRLVADGRSTREIGELLGLSMKTVESHRGAVMKRLVRHNVADLVRYAVRTGIVKD
jgi:DNA-binding NarL/FixJ family response regulator